MASAGRLISALARIIYPEVCAVCNDSLVEGEEAICLHCLAKLPRTGIHTLPFNTVHERLAAPGLLTDRAGAWFHYQRGNPYTAIIHDAKYRGLPSIARKCAEIYAREIAADNFFSGIDLLLPVPLHKSKRNLRGYNQAEEIAKGISAVTGIPVGLNLTATRPHATQTHRGAWQRWINAEGSCAVVRPGEIAGRHVMIVDDVITTGATLLSCLKAISEASPSTRTSVIALAATHLQ